MRLPAGEYTVTTGCMMTPEAASADVFPPDALVVHVGTRYHGDTVTFVYLIDYPDEPDCVLA